MDCYRIFLIAVAVAPTAFSLSLGRRLAVDIQTNVRHQRHFMRTASIKSRICSAVWSSDPGEVWQPPPPTTAPMSPTTDCGVAPPFRAKVASVVRRVLLPLSERPLSRISLCNRKTVVQGKHAAAATNAAAAVANDDSCSAQVH